MKNTRVVITEFGGPELLSVVEEDELPQPAAGEVRVRVLARCANFTDTMIRKGMYPGVKQKPPFTPPYDILGAVDACGKGTDDALLGRRVAELTVTGSYSEYMCLPASRLVPVPEDVDPAEAACLVLSYVTAYQMLHRKARLAPGDKILVHGAGGAVGSALLQLGGIMELEMYGTASAGKHPAVSGLGARPIDYRAEDFVDAVKRHEPDGVDAVFDPIGGDNFLRSFRTLARGGKLVAYGFYNSVQGKGGSAALDFLRLTLAGLLPNGRSAGFYSIAPWRKKHPEWFRDDLETLFHYLQQGKIKPIIDSKLPLTDARRAHEQIENADVVGKIVLTSYE